MSFQSKQGIVPQLPDSFAMPVRTMLVALILVFPLFLVSCSSVQLQANQPVQPNSLDEARAYMASRDEALRFLEYELNEQSRACYKNFFVSSCLDDVRLQGAEIRRAHLEVQGKAEDIIRLNDYSNRRSRNTK